MKYLYVVKSGFSYWKSKPHYFFSLFYLLLYTYNRIHGMVAYVQNLNTTITPWLFPFLPGSGLSFIPLVFAFIILISDAPFRTKQQLYVILRIGKRRWICGQLLYLLTVSLGYTLLLWVLSWLWILPELVWRNQWGPAITTAAVTGGYAEYGVFINIKYGVMKNADPISVSIWCASVLCSVCFFLGTIMATCNLWLKEGIGAAIVSILVVISVIPSIFAQEPGLVKFLVWISPISWMDRSLMGNIGQGLPPYGYGIITPTILGTVLSITLISTIHKCNLETNMGG